MCKESIRMAPSNVKIQHGSRKVYFRFFSMYVQIFPHPCLRFYVRLHRAVKAGTKMYFPKEEATSKMRTHSGWPS